MNRRMKWSLLIAGPVLLIGALLIVDMTTMEPYLQYKAVINRKTGEYIVYEVYFDHFAKRYYSNVQPIWIDLSPYGKLTAPDIEVLEGTIVYKQHFWSMRMMGEQVDQVLGHRLMQVFSTLFADLARSQQPSAQALDLYRQRIEIWNSDFPERATRGDIKKLQTENALLFPEHVR